MQATLQQVFLNFTKKSPDMDGKTFFKVAKDSKLVDNKLTQTDIDIIFAKVKNGPRTANYASFEKGVGLWAEKKGISFQEISALIVNAGGPQFQGTKADNVKFHDDKNLYTGVHANGGPSTIDNNHGGLQNICDRKAADVRGVKK